MSRQPAKVLRPADIRSALRAARNSRHPVRNRVMVLLSVRAGLRACEISALTWRMVLTPQGAIGNTIELPPSAAKKGSGRRIPIHAELKAALHHLRKHACLGQEAVILSERGERMTAKSVVNWFARLYDDIGLDGCSSHSGRRTFITTAARLVHKAGGSMRDVQQLAGHRSMKTTQAYIDGDTEAQRRLVRLL